MKCYEGSQPKLRCPSKTNKKSKKLAILSPRLLRPRPSPQASTPPHQNMEVEVKLRLPDEANHARLKSVLSAFHMKTLKQKNYFFDSVSNTLSIKNAALRLRFSDTDSSVLSLKANPRIANGVSHVEEDEEEIDLLLAHQLVSDPSKLGSCGSRIVRRCKEEFEIHDMVFVCLGGFENVRDVYAWNELKLEVDETMYGFSVGYELECECSSDPEMVKMVLERFLVENAIVYQHSQMSKFAIFRSGRSR